MLACDQLQVLQARCGSFSGSGALKRCQHRLHTQHPGASAPPARRTAAAAHRDSDLHATGSHIARLQPAAKGIQLAEEDVGLKPAFAGSCVEV